MDAGLYQQALDAVAIANAARGIHEHPGGPGGDREEFPIVDSEATILVTPGEPLAEVLILGNPTGVSVSAIPDGAGGYIFVPPDADGAGELGNVIGFPIAPDDVINSGVVMNENQSIGAELDRLAQEYPEYSREEIRELGTEPDGSITSGNIVELEGILKARKLGVIDGPLSPSRHVSHDIVDGHGQEWDIKQLRSERGPIDFETELNKWKVRDLPHENILIDTEFMTENDIVALEEALSARPEFNERFRFSPPR